MPVFHTDSFFFIIVHYVDALPNIFFCVECDYIAEKGQMTKEKPDDMLPLINMTDPREIPKNGPVTVGKER